MHSTHTPRKRFGQHFLHDEAIIRRIIASINPTPNEHIVEIGPGEGALTFPLLMQNPHLEVIELDRDLIPKLLAQQTRYPKLIVHAASALDFDFASLQTDPRSLRIVGNLPYNISTPLIFHLLSFYTIISDMVFMLQKEVAQRLAAKPSSEHYGRLSVMVQYHCNVHLLFDVPAHAFTPPPKVLSSIVQLKPHKTLPYVAHDYEIFSSVVKQAFGQRRKTLRNSLQHLIDKNSWADIKIDPQARAENLSVYDYVSLANYIHSNPAES